MMVYSISILMMISLEMIFLKVLVHSYGMIFNPMRIETTTAALINNGHTALIQPEIIW